MIGDVTVGGDGQIRAFVRTYFAARDTNPSAGPSWVLCAPALGRRDRRSGAWPGPPAGCRSPAPCALPSAWGCSETPVAGHGLARLPGSGARTAGVGHWPENPTA